MMFAFALSVTCFAVGIWATEYVGFEHSPIMQIGFMGLISGGAFFGWGLAFVGR